jgi:hypothetical protein
MTDISTDIPHIPHVPRATSALDIASAARAFLRRSGFAETEMRRRLMLRDTVRSSRALAHALTEFAAQAAAHSQDVHCRSHLDAHVDALVRALAEWSESMSATASLYHESCDHSATHGFATSTAYLEA